MKYIIELEDTPFNGLYKAKGFNSLVFDENGLKKLKPAQEEFAQHHNAGYALGLKEIRQSLTESSLESYNKGLNDAWELAKKVVLNENESGMSLGDLHKAFGDFSYYCILKFSSGVEAWSAYNKFLKSKRIEEELKVKTRIESIAETAAEVTFTLTDGTKRVISIEDITGGSDRNDTERERERELCKKIQNDLYQMSAKYNVSNQQDYFIVMGIYLAIDLIAKNYVNKTDDDTEHQTTKMFVHFPKEKE